MEKRLQTSTDVCRRVGAPHYIVDPDNADRIGIVRTHPRRVVWWKFTEATGYTEDGIGPVPEGAPRLRRGDESKSN